MIYSDLRELKSELEIDPENTSEDQSLSRRIKQASALMDLYLTCPPKQKESKTEFYKGYGTPKLVLKRRPVFTDPAIQCFVSRTGYWGQSTDAFTDGGDTLTYGSDFVLEVDGDTGGDVTSKRGLLWRLDGLWPNFTVRTQGLITPYTVPAYGNIKVIYTAGYTVDTLPEVFRFCCNELAARIRYFFPQAQALAGDGYEERSLSFNSERKDYLMAIVKQHLFPFRTWRF